MTNPWHGDGIRQVLKAPVPPTLETLDEIAEWIYHNQPCLECTSQTFEDRCGNGGAGHSIEEIKRVLVLCLRRNCKKGGIPAIRELAETGELQKLTQTWLYKTTG